MYLLKTRLILTTQNTFASVQDKPNKNGLNNKYTGGRWLIMNLIIFCLYRMNTAINKIDL